MKKLRNKKKIIGLILLMVIFTVGFVGGYKISSINYPSTEISEENIEEKEDIYDGSLPQCWSINCPKIEAMDVDGDSEYETVITEYPTMTQQAGRVWVIKDGKMLFKSDVLAQISVSQKTNEVPNNGFEILYNTEGKISPDFEKGWTTNLYIWNGKDFTINKTEKVKTN